MRFDAVLLLVVALSADLTAGQSAPPRPPAGSPPPANLLAERIGPNLLRVGRIRIDTSLREVSVAGKVNDVAMLEWVANTEGGLKAYESAITLETDAVMFNAAMLLIGLDKGHARLPGRHFDPAAPQGDLVEISVEWKDGTRTRRIRVEEMLFDKRTNATMPEGPWVYTGSMFLADTNQYLAQLDGVLIGFVHSPAPVIENPRVGAVGAYGAILLNKAIVAPGTAVTLIVKGVGRTKK